MAVMQKTADGRRLDLLLCDETLSRSQAARLIREGHAHIDGVPVIKPSCIPKAGAQVILDLPDPVEALAKAEDIPISILYEDDAIAVINKPAGLVVHPAAGNETGTLVNALLFKLDHLSGIGGEKRPGIVHRLDKDTSGLMLVAKCDRAHLLLSRQLAERRVEKQYLAVVWGQMKEQSGRVDLPIARSTRDRKKMAIVEGGKPAQTQWRLVRQNDKSALLLIHLITGRTHQIRVHLSCLGHPVLGDPLYGHSQAQKAPRLMLHACALGFEHPMSGERMQYYAFPDPAFCLTQAEFEALFR